jgi:hypothetical protein
MRVLIGCESSGVVRRAFRDRGHDAWSCDLLASEDDSPFHYQCNVREVIGEGWDLFIVHPTCQFLCNSGVRWLHTESGRLAKMRAGAEFFRDMLAAPIPRIAAENPIPHGYAISIIGRRYDQTIQPWQFGHGESKRTCLWLKNLPKLKPTNIVAGREQRIWKMPPGPNRWRERSRTFDGIGQAMAEQWGECVQPSHRTELFT